MKTHKWLKFIILSMVILIPISMTNGALVSNTLVDEEIEYYIQADKETYQLGESVVMLFQVTNLSTEDITIPCSRDPELNLSLQNDDGNIWTLFHWFKWYSPGVQILSGETTELSYTWDMRDDNDILVNPGTYSVYGIMYNEPWNYDNHGNYYTTEVGISINILPEPTSLTLLALGGIQLFRIN